jgi:nucleoside-diphosphate-sugar epimerase
VAIPSEKSPGFEGPTALVVGGTGVVGSLVVNRLREEGAGVFSLTRRGGQTALDLSGDFAAAESLQLPRVPVVFSSTPIALLPAAIPALARAGATRVVALSSVNVVTRGDSGTLFYEESCARRCDEHGIAWTFLRPTLIYREGHDINISRIASLIRRFGIFPLYGKATGRRQPVHARDVADAMIMASRSEAAANKAFEIGGGEILPYCEMVGRIFDALHLRRRLLKLPPAAWEALFAISSPFIANIRSDMGARMMEDFIVDHREAELAFGWKPRLFRPDFSY